MIIDISEDGYMVTWKSLVTGIQRSATIVQLVEAFEAESIKHGRWKAWDLTWGRSIYVCTSCGDAMEVPTENGKPIFNYCPNCGARMDGGENDDR